MPCIDQTPDSCTDVRWASKQKGDDSAVSKSTHDVREEVREAIGSGDADVERDEEDHLPIECSHLETGPNTRLGFGSRDSVRGDASGSDSAHVFSHGPHRTARLRVWVVGQNPESDQSKTGSTHGEDDEEPLPASNAIFLHDMLALASDLSLSKVIPGRGFQRRQRR